MKDDDDRARQAQEGCPPSLPPPSPLPPPPSPCCLYCPADWTPAGRCADWTPGPTISGFAAGLRRTSEPSSSEQPAHSCLTRELRL